MLVAGIVLLLAPSALASILPAPYSSEAIAAFSAAKNNTGFNAYTMAFAFSEPITIAVVQGYCPSYCTYTITPGWQNVSKPTAFSGVLSSGQTWVNGTGSCGPSACPVGTVTCDGTPFTLTPAPSTVVSAPCFALQLAWGSGAFLAPPGLTALYYTLNRLLLYTVVTHMLWTASGQTATEVASISSPSSSLFAPILYNWSIPSASWVLPFTKGSWNYGSLSVIQQPNRTALPPDQYTVYYQYVLIQWTGGFPSTGPATNLTFLLSISTTSGLAGVNTWKLTNQSLPAITLPPATSIVLFLGNKTILANGHEQLSVTWGNPYSLNYSGAFVLESSILATATSINITANGQPIPRQNVALSGSSAYVTSGVVTVPNGSAVTFVVDFILNVPWSFFAPFAYVNGFGISPAIVTSGVTGAIALIAYFAAPRLKFGRIVAGDIAGIAAASTLIVLWVVL